MFFVLSGFLITALLVREEIESGTISLKAFYTRRALRILPAFLTFICVISVLIRYRLVTDVPWYSVVVACLYLSNLFGRGDTIGHLWSLSLEEQFYALWPLLFRKIGRMRALRVACGLIVLVSSFRAVAIMLSTSDFYFSGRVYERPWFRFDSVLAGCVVSLLLYSRSSSLMQRVPRLSPVLTFTTLIVWTIVAERYEWCRPLFLTVQMTLSAYLLLTIVALPSSSSAKLCCSTTLRWLGKVSYSVYLWQQVFLISRFPSWGVFRRFPVNVFCALMAGVISHYVIEQPFLKIKTRFQKSRKSSPTGSIPPKRHTDETERSSLKQAAEASFAEMTF